MSFLTADIEMDAAGIRLFRCREETGVLLQRYGPRHGNAVMYLQTESI